MPGRTPCARGCARLYVPREVVWANGHHHHILILAALVRSQRKAILRLNVRTCSAELHRIFGQGLQGTLSAAPLLHAARQLRASPGVADALDVAMADVTVVGETPASPEPAAVAEVLSPPKTV